MKRLSKRSLLSVSCSALFLILLTVAFAYAQQAKPPVSAKESVESHPLDSEILISGIPDPITLRLTNHTENPYFYSTFMSKHATMPPMPNVRIDIENRSTKKVITYCPVVLSKPLGSLSLKSGDSRDIYVYYHDLEDLSPGTYKVTVCFFKDHDDKQQTPIVVSQALLVQVRTGAEIGGAPM